MKVNELMIGDWVVSEIEGAGRITELGRDWCVALTYGKNNNAVTGELRQLQPIPLTPEILKKNGFGYVEGDEYSTYHPTHFYLGESQFCKSMDLHIGTYNKGIFWVNIRQNAIYGIRYVHELQHALRMCGYNDLADNFKI